VSAPGPKTIGLGLQGGGAHAAFTWGVLERLLDEVAAGRLIIKKVSGTSGGALNAAALTFGLRDGPEEAKARLRQLWSEVARFTPRPLDFSRFFTMGSGAERWNVDWTPSAVITGFAEQVVSPYGNPFYVNGLAPLIARVIPDFDALNRTTDTAAPELFVCATDVAGTARRIFAQPDIRPDSLLAAACYPTLFQAVHVDKVALWDGGYMGNPALEPLLDGCDDLLTVMINPLDRAGEEPKNAREILDRINEVGFNTAWVMEMRQILLVNQFLERGWLTGNHHYTPKRFHLIRDDAFMQAIGVSSKRNASPDFLEALRQRGFETADAWVLGHLDKVGVTSSFDVETEVALRLNRPPDPPTGPQP
jgi:NTE family protein